MSNEVILNNLGSNLQYEVQSNEDSNDSIAFLNTLIYNKHDKNSDLLRTDILQSFATNNQALRSNLAQYSDLITRYKFTNDAILYETKKASDKARTRKMSVDFEDLNDYEEKDKNEDAEEEDENVSQLRKRLLQGGRSKSEDHTLESTTFDEKLHMEEQRQEDILKDMFQFVRSIKEGADAFNAKLGEDQNVLKAAEAGLDATSKKLSKTGKDLSKTIQSLGLFDALKLFGVVILSFFLCLIIIKIFPKW